MKGLADRRRANRPPDGRTSLRDGRTDLYHIKIKKPGCDCSRASLLSLILRTALHVGASFVALLARHASHMAFYSNNLTALEHPDV